MRRRKKLLLIGIICFVVMCVSGVYAITKDSEVKGALSTGAVQINVETYTIDELGTEVVYSESDKQVMPGNEISLIPRVINKGESCYLRAKIDISSEQLCSVMDISEDWTKYGEYYYLNTPLEKQGNVDVFHWIKIADEISNENQGEEITISIIIEAIQEKNFEPDYSLDDPWKGEEIEKCIEKSYSIDGDGIDAITVSYSPDSIEVISDFFNELETVMPGDEISELVKIKNKHSENTEIFMNVIPENTDEEVNELLKSLIITISDENGNVIYEGNIYEFTITSLGKFNSGEQRQLAFKMKLPTELNNQYSKISGSLNWSFYTEDEKKDDKEDDKEDEHSKDEEKHSNHKHPKTGDFKFDTSVIVFFASAMGMIIVMFLWVKDRRKNI